MFERHSPPMVFAPEGRATARRRSLPYSPGNLSELPELSLVSQDKDKRFARTSPYQSSSTCGNCGRNRPHQHSRAVGSDPRPMEFARN
jgi:hypothetical protein